MILDRYLNVLFTATTAFNGGVLSNFSYLRLGTSDATVDRSQLSIQGSQLYGGQYDSYANSTLGDYPVQRIYNFIIPAGTATGTIKEMALCQSSGANMGSARQIIVPAIEKSDVHELRVTAIISLKRSADYWSGTLAGKQRDGVTDINWVATANNRQLYNVALNIGGIGWASKWYTATGTSNDPSDLVSDLDNNIKGTQLFNGNSNLSTPLDYTAGSFYRDYKFGFEINQSNGAIAEMTAGAHSNFRFLRMTFDPPLDKVDDHRLFLTVRFAVVNPS
jgi:hypothetical protein